MNDALAGTDVEAISRAVENLKSAAQSMGQKIYEAAGAANSSAGGGTGSGPTDSSGSEADHASDDEIADAEIVDEPSSGADAGTATGTEGE